MAPTDEELLELMPQGFRDDLALVSRMAAHGAGPEVQPGLFRVTLNTGALDYARAVWDRARAALAGEPVAVPDRLPELRGMFERILCVARSSGEKPVGNIELADRLIKAVVSWAASGGTLAAEADGPAVPEGREPASVAGEPSDEDLLSLWGQAILGLAKGSTQAAVNLAFARAVLARFGHQPAPPAEGEVAELVAALRLMAHNADLDCQFDECESLTRDADLLEQCQAALVPVAVADRLPELRGMFERILCVARSSDQKPVGNIELADRLIKAVVSRAASGAALAAEPVVAPAGPTDEELRQMFVAHSMVILPDEGDDVAPLGLDAAGASSFARAVLARWGHQPAPPAEGEVAELVAWLRANSSGVYRPCSRAADLLEQRHPAPVPASKRPWEREGWCDEQGRCWWGRQETDDWYADWTLSTYEDTQEFCTYNPMTVCLPANALPLPATTHDIESND